MKRQSNSIKIKTKNKLYPASNIINLKNNNKNNSSKNIHTLLITDDEYPIIKKENKNIKLLKDLINDSYSFCYLDNTFIVFKSINNILCIIYTDKNISIISYDLIDNKKINTIKKAHNKCITNFRHYLDKNNKRDLIISISCHDNNIKLWNANNLDCLHNFENIYTAGQLFSACFLYDNIKNEILIIAGNSNFNNLDYIKILDLNGNTLEKINNSNDNIFFIDNYYDENVCKNFIITGNFGYVKSYDYFNKKLYHKYSVNDNRSHNSIIINNNNKGVNNNIQLIESSYDGDIRIWDFHSGELIKTINVLDDIYNICLWSDEYIFVGCKNGMLKLISLKNGKTEQNINGHTKSVLTIKKIEHPLYRECLITQGNDQRIILWINE